MNDVFIQSVKKLHRTTLTMKSGKLQMNAVKGLQFDQYGYPKNSGTAVTLRIVPDSGKVTEV